MASDVVILENSAKVLPVEAFRGDRNHAPIIGQAYNSVVYTIFETHFLLPKLLPHFQ